MAQHDYVIDNSTGANVRADINSVLQAIASNNSGSSAPSTTFASQFFADSNASILKLRNTSNNGYVNLFNLDGSLVADKVVTASISDDAVTQAKVANDAIGADELASNAVVNASVASGAAIAGTKISPDFGSQNVSTTATVNTPSINGGQIGNKRLNINGAMRISQRGSSFGFAHDTTTSALTLDRYKFRASSLEEFDCTVSQDSSVPDGQGFSKSLKVLTGTAESSVGADERVELQYNFEGQDLQPLAYGVSGAKKIIVSFYVKSSITGTFGFSIYRNESTDRIVNKPYTINSANTWERKTIEIDGDTSAAITDDTSERARFVWFLLAGSDFTSGGTQSSYANYSNPFYAGGHAQNGVATTAGATWFITGIQVEVNSSGVASDFEHRSISDELLRCYRYFQILSSNTSGGLNAHSRYPLLGNGTNSAIWYAYHKATMRVKPSLVKSGITSSTMDIFNFSTSSTATFSNMVMAEGDENHSQLVCTTTNAFAIAQIGSWRWSTNADCYFAVDSEL